MRSSGSSGSSTRSSPYCFQSGNSGANTDQSCGAAGATKRLPPVFFVGFASSTAAKDWSVGKNFLRGAGLRSFSAHSARCAYSLMPLLVSVPDINTTFVAGWSRR